MKLPIIETNGTFHTQLQKIEEEITELKIEMDRHPVSVEDTYFEMMDILAAANNLVEMADIPKYIKAAWVEKMKNKPYKIKEWK